MHPVCPQSALLPQSLLNTFHRECLMGGTLQRPRCQLQGAYSWHLYQNLITSKHGTSNHGTGALSTHAQTCTWTGPMAAAARPAAASLLAAPIRVHTHQPPRKITTVSPFKRTFINAEAYARSSHMAASNGWRIQLQDRTLGSEVAKLKLLPGDTAA